MNTILIPLRPTTRTRRPLGPRRSSSGLRPERGAAQRTRVEGPRPERGLAVRGGVEGLVRRSPQGEGGFTILEVMIAAVIILLVLVGLLSALAKSQQLKENTAEYQTALEAARQQFELIQSATYNTIFATYNNTNFAVPGLTPLPLGGLEGQDSDGFVGRVTINNADPNLLLVTISLQWQGVMSQVRNNQASVQSYVLTTQIADRNR